MISDSKFHEKALLLRNKPLKTFIEKTKQNHKHLAFQNEFLNINFHKVSIEIP